MVDESFIVSEFSSRLAPRKIFKHNGLSDSCNASEIGLLLAMIRFRQRREIMANEVRIKLTDEQKAKIKEATGKDMGEIRVGHLGDNPAVSAKTMSASKATRANIMHAKATRSTRANIMHAKATRSTRANIISAKATRSTRANIVNAKATRSTRANIVNAKATRSTRANIVNAKATRSTRSTRALPHAQ
jgi:hypothetical protein